MNYIALFFTHSGAIKYNRFLREKDIKTETSPIPRKLSSSCGIGVRFYMNGNIDEILSEDLEKIYEIKEEEYNLVYQCE